MAPPDAEPPEPRPEPGADRPGRRRTSSGRILFFWALFLVAGIGGIRLIDRLVASSSEKLVGARADVSQLPGLWSDGRTTARVRGQSGMLAVAFRGHGPAAGDFGDAYLLHEQKSGVLSRNPAFVSEGDPRIAIRLIDAGLEIEVTGSDLAGLPPHALLRRMSE